MTSVEVPKAEMFFEFIVYELTGAWSYLYHIKNIINYAYFFLGKQAIMTPGYIGKIEPLAKVFSNTSCFQNVSVNT